MTEYAQRMQEWLQGEQVDAQVLAFSQSVHSVEEAIEASGHPIDRISKTIVMLTAANDCVIAMVPANTRASTERVRKALSLDERPRIASAAETEQHLGQQIGGNSPLNAAQATILIDPMVLEQEWIITGGGDNRHLVKISIEELKRVVDFTETRVRK